MKSFTSSLFSLFAFLILTCSHAMAADLSATVTLTSDYVFDGVSQTDSNPALQGSLDYSHDSGFYAGAWGSNVDFGPGDDANIEIDLYSGYSADISESVAIDVGAVRYTYTGVGSSGYDYTEFYTGFTFNENTVIQAWYANDKDVFNGSAYRIKLTHAFPLPREYALAVETTYTDQVDLDSDFLHFSVGIQKSFSGFDLDLSYHDTDINANDTADGRLVFSVSRSF